MALTIVDSSRRCFSLTSLFYLASCLQRTFMLLHTAKFPVFKKKVKQYLLYVYNLWTSLVAKLVKSLPAMQETWVRFLDWEDPLEKEMATHSSILVWRIPWTEEPGRLQSMGSQSRTRLRDFTSLQGECIIQLGMRTCKNPWQNN